MLARWLYRLCSWVFFALAVGVFYVACREAGRAADRALARMESAMDRRY